MTAPEETPAYTGGTAGEVVAFAPPWVEPEAGPTEEGPGYTGGTAGEMVTPAEMVGVTVEEEAPAPVKATRTTKATTTSESS